MKTKNIPFVDLYAQYKNLKDQIDNSISECIINSDFIRSKSVSIFETEFAKLNNILNCISCANGTDALYIAMKSLNFSIDSEVITTALSWIATSEAITEAGGRAVFCDINPRTFCIDENQIESLINNKTVGIIPVHLYGQPCNMDKIIEISKKYNLWVIEDCAQAHLAEYKGQLVGSFGDIATYSFYPSKNLGAMGDAGCITTNNNKLAKWMKLYAQHGGKNIHEIEGINSRMDGLQASILNIKIKYLDSWTKRRIEIADFYIDSLKDVGDIILPELTKGTKHVFHLFTIRTKFRDELKEYLKIKGISTVVNYPRPLPLLPCYSESQTSNRSFQNSIEICDTILSIPLYPELDKSDQNLIVKTIKEFYNNKI
tara:strand:- start:2037 stop:3152 length:1116 start_codon:yes stop_codon:yes gene_type:complete